MKEPFPNRAAGAGTSSEDVRIPLVEEEVRVGKREVETGRVRVRTRVDEERLNLSEMLEHDVVEVERVPVGAEVQTAPVPFEKDGMLIIPIVEERLVVEKRLVVVEELRIRREQLRERVDVPVSRRVMRAEVDRAAPEPHQPSPAPRPDHAVGSMPEHGPAPRRPAFEPEAAPQRAAPASAGLRAAPGPSVHSAPPVQPKRRETNWTMLILGTLALLALLLGIARALQTNERTDAEESSLSSAEPDGPVRLTS